LTTARLSSASYCDVSTPLSSGISTSGFFMPISTTDSRDSQDGMFTPSRPPTLARSDSAFSGDSRLSTPQSSSTNKNYDKGQIITMSNGVRKKFNGKQWRRLCSYDGECMKESQRKGYCSRHLTAAGSHEDRQSGVFYLSSSYESSSVDRSEEREVMSRQFDENEAANMLVSLADHNSTVTHLQMDPRNPQLPTDSTARNPRLLSVPIDVHSPRTVTNCHTSSQFDKCHQASTSECNHVDMSAVTSCQSERLKQSFFTIAETSLLTDCTNDIPVHVIDPSLTIVTSAVSFSAGTSKTSLSQDSSRLMTASAQNRAVSQRHSLSHMTGTSSAYSGINHASITFSKEQSQLTTTTTTTTAAATTTSAVCSDVKCLCADTAPVSVVGSVTSVSIAINTAAVPVYQWHCLVPCMTSESSLTYHRLSSSRDSDISSNFNFSFSFLFM